MVTALQIGLPGVQELFIILLIFLLLAVPFAAVVALLVLYRRSSGSAADERIEELEREVAELRDRQGEASPEADDEAGGSGGATTED